MIAERESKISQELPSQLPRRPRSAPRPDHPRLDQRVPRPMGERGPRVVRRVRALGWRSPMSAAVLFASFCVFFASFYVSAYARVALQSVEKDELSREIRAGAQHEEALHAQISGLTLGSMIQERAAEMKMERNSPQSTDLLLPGDASVTPLAAGREMTSTSSASFSRQIVP